MRDLLPVHFAALGAIVERHGGHIFKTVGDAVYAAFTDVAAACAAAHEAQATDLSLPVRIAVTAGEVESTENDFFGPALNLAARLVALGEPGRVLLPLALAGSMPHRALGVVRLKGISDLVAVAELANDLPLMMLPCAGPVLIPLPLTPIIGREDLREDILRRLQKARLVTMTGFGGTGKTRLAIDVGLAAAGFFPGGLVFCDLSELPALDSVEHMRGVVQRSLSELTAGQPRLLILDNCEHVLKNITRVVQDALSTDATLVVLATSRVGLPLAGQVQVPIPPLPPSAAAELLTARLDALGVTASADLTLKICEQVNGIPLAMELAAARCEAFSPDQVYERMRSSTKFLRSPDSLNDRHAGMESVIGWSVDLLSAPARQALENLSVLIGGFDYWSAMAVLNLTEADDLDGIVEELARASLIHRDDRRYRFLEPVRGFALERLQQHSARMTEVKERLIGYVEELAREAHPMLQGESQAVWLARLSAEHPNVRSAFEWIVEPARRAELAVLLHGFWLATNRAAEGRSWAEAALARLPAAQLSPEVDSMAGVLAWSKQDFESAIAHMERAVSKTPHEPPTALLVKVLTNLGLAHASAGNLERGEECLQQALAAATVADVLRVPHVLVNLGRLATEQKRFPEATDLLSRAEVAFAAQGNERQARNARALIAENYRTFGDLERAAAQFRQLAMDAYGLGEIEEFANEALRYGLAAEDDEVVGECMALLRELNLNPKLAAAEDRDKVLEFQETFDISAEALAARIFDRLTSA